MRELTGVSRGQRTLHDHPDWMARECARPGVDPGLWFEPDGRQERAKERKARVAAARKLCAHCPIKAACLSYAMEHEPFGIWGGLTAKERKAARAEATLAVDGRAAGARVSAEAATRCRTAQKQAVLAALAGCASPRDRAVLLRKADALLTQVGEAVGLPFYRAKWQAVILARLLGLDKDRCTVGALLTAARRAGVLAPVVPVPAARVTAPESAGVRQTEVEWTPGEADCATQPIRLRMPRRRARAAASAGRGQGVLKLGVPA